MHQRGSLKKLLPLVGRSPPATGLCLSLALCEKSHTLPDDENAEHRREDGMGLSDGESSGPAAEVPSRLKVSALVTKLAARLSLGWSPSLPSLGRPVRFVWGDRDLSERAQQLELHDDVLRVRGEGLLELSLNGDTRQALRNQPFEGELADGSHFAAELAHLESDFAEGHYWTLNHPDRRSQIWVGRVRGLTSFDSVGNVYVTQRHQSDDGTEVRQSSWLNHRFRGTYTYYLIRRVGNGEALWHLIIQTDDGTSSPQRRLVYQDMLALQFVLGNIFHFDLILGLNERLETVGVVGGRHGREQRGRRVFAEPPVPIFLSREHWPSAFFARISDTYRSKPELRLYIPLAFYLDAIDSAHVEGRYLFLHVALEAFAYWFLGEKDAPPPLVNKSKWRSWLNSSREIIKGLASPGKGELLFQKITSIPARRASSQVVETAFSQLKLEIGTEMASDLEEGRGKIVHTAVMFEESQADVEAYRGPIAVVRTMLVALIARAVGYDGAILGWTRAPGRPYDEPANSWWPVSDQSRVAALQQFECSLPAEDDL